MNIIDRLRKEIQELRKLNPEKKFRIATCKGKQVIQTLEPNGNWLCLH